MRNAGLEEIQAGIKIAGRNINNLRYIYIYGFSGSSWVKNLHAVQETLVLFLSGKDPLEKGQAIHSSILGLPWWLRQ